MIQLMLISLTGILLQKITFKIIIFNFVSSFTKSGKKNQTNPEITKMFVAGNLRNSFAGSAYFDACVC